MIRCPACGKAETEVLQSRKTEAGKRRRRACSCGARFTTLETLAGEQDGKRWREPVREVAEAMHLRALAGDAAAGLLILRLRA